MAPHAKPGVGHAARNEVVPHLAWSGGERPPLNPLRHYLEEGWRQDALPCDPVRLLGEVKVGVVVHLFYADLWNEIAARLRSIPIAFDLFVTLPQEHAGELSSLVLRTHPRAKVIPVPNRGRDVGAFFAVLPSLLEGNYAVICKLHSKKGSDYPEAWRDLLLRGLLGNELLVARILYAFACDPDLVLAGPREVYLSGVAQMAENREKLEEILRCLYPARSLPPRWGFFAGTMFWARPDFFRPFLEGDSHIRSFEGDNTRNDGQLAHAFERMFGALAALAGKRIGFTEITGNRPFDSSIQITLAPGQPWEGSFLRVLKGRALQMSGHMPLRRDGGCSGPQKGGAGAMGGLDGRALPGHVTANFTGL